MFGPFINEKWGSRGLTTGHILRKAWVSFHLQITKTLQLPRSIFKVPKNQLKTPEEYTFLISTQGELLYLVQWSDDSPKSTEQRKYLNDQGVSPMIFVELCSNSNFIFSLCYL